MSVTGSKTILFLTYILRCHWRAGMIQGKHHFWMLAITAEDPDFNATQSMKPELNSWVLHTSPHLGPILTIGRLPFLGPLKQSSCLLVSWASYRWGELGKAWELFTVISSFEEEITEMPNCALHFSQSRQESWLDLDPNFNFSCVHSVSHKWILSE